MIEKFEGIILSEIKYGETSKIINVLTEKFGIIGIYVKGALNIKSPFHNTTNKLMLCEFIIKYNKDKLSNLKEVTIKNNFKEVKKDIIKIGYASFLVDLTNQVYKEGNNYNLYYNLKEALAKINNGLNPIVITNIIMLKYLDNLGVSPMLDCCVSCGSTTDICTISSYKGGLVCKNCLDDLELVTPKTIKLIQIFTKIDIKKIDKIDLNKQIISELDNFLDDYYNRYTGLYLKSKKFLDEIKK